MLRRTLLLLLALCLSAPAVAQKAWTERRKAGRATDDTQPVGRLASTATILLVEDHAINRKLMQALLGKLGLAFVCAENGQEALDALESRPMVYDADQMARAGVFVSIRHDGQLAIERGVRQQLARPVAGRAARDR